MTWTYSGNPASSNRDNVRHKIGDTDTDDQLLQNEEIDKEIADYGDLDLAAAAACDRIVSRFARKIDRSGLGMSASRSQLVQHYTDLARRLRLEAGKRSEIFVGGLSKDEKDNLLSDEDRVQPSFRIGQDDIKDPLDTRQGDRIL